MAVCSYRRRPTKEEEQQRRRAVTHGERNSNRGRAVFGGEE
jgi:hypothetical protein